jgi:hypothetical protein
MEAECDSGRSRTDVPERARPDPRCGPPVRARTQFAVVDSPPLPTEVPAAN